LLLKQRLSLDVIIPKRLLGAFQAAPQSAADVQGTFLSNLSEPARTTDHIANPPNSLPGQRALAGHAAP
jgi:hypothetical protein